MRDMGSVCSSFLRGGICVLSWTDETCGIRGIRLVNVKDGRNLPGRRLSGWKQYPSYEAALARTGMQANTRDPRSWMNDLIIVSIFAFREERERDKSESKH